MSDQVLLRDLVAIPDEVHAGDFVLTLGQGVREKSTITDYVVTESLAADFDRALGLIRSALEMRGSRAAYLDGSFGSGKSHFMAMLHAILSGNPDARGKKGLADIVHKHDQWLKGRRFLLVPYHLPESPSLEAAILGGYVAHLLREHPGTPLPAVYRDEGLLADARELRDRVGDEGFIGLLPKPDADWDEPGDPWTTAKLDEAFAEPPGAKPPVGDLRRKLVSALVSGPFRRYADAVRGEHGAFIPLDDGLSVISKHAREVLGYDAVVLLLDELVLWLAGHIANSAKISNEAQKVSKLVESAEYERPAPVISFVPRQRDLRDLVRKDAYGSETTSLFDTLKYWDGRFDSIRLDDRNLPAIVQERLLRPKDAAARAALDEAFRSTVISPQDWDILLDTHGEKSDRESFRRTYPFSPAFLHAMVDISGALQRERTALKLMQQLLVDYRDTLPVGQLMPLGAIFDVLASGADRPFTDKLREEFEQAKRFYTVRLRPWLLNKYRLSEEQAARVGPRHEFRAADLVVKTLLLAALVPNVPALSGLTANRLAALNHGSIRTMLPRQERQTVTRVLGELSAQFGEFRLSGNPDDPRVDLALIGIDTEGIIAACRHADDDAARRRLVRAMLWKEIGLADSDTFETRAGITWRGTERAVDVLLDNIRDEDRMPSARFQPDPGTIRLVIDYPWDIGNFGPVDDMNRVHKLQTQLGDADTLLWLPHFLSEERLADLSALVIINYVLERDRLAEATPALTADDRERARTLLDSRRSALTVRLGEALRRAYGVSSRDESDLGSLAAEQVMSLASGLEPRLALGQGMAAAFRRLCFQLLDHRYPSHPDFDPNGRGVEVKPAELETVLAVVDMAAQDKVGRTEVPRADIPVLKKIANPLKLGVMHEAAFVLGHDWPELINRKSAGRPQVKAGEVREWIDQAQPGLPPLVQNLVIACYAIAADKAWLRSGQPAPAPRVRDVADDMTLRAQELPDEEEFERACARAQAIFGVPRQPVRSARATQALAEAVRAEAGGRRQAAEALAAELDRHAATLGLDEDSPRMRTSRVITALLARLVAADGATATLRELAGAGLPRENAIYSEHLASAGPVATALRDRNWRVLDDIAARADDDGQPDAVTIIAALREAARRDEHEVPLAARVLKADQAALDLMMEWTRQATPPPPRESASTGNGAGTVAVGPGSAAPPAPPRQVPVSPGGAALGTTEVQRVRGKQVHALLAEIRAAADASPDALFEVSWQIVPD